MRLFLGNAIQGFLLQKLLNCFARPRLIQHTAGIDTTVIVTLNTF